MSVRHGSKKLSPRQDNEKNRNYLGGRLDEGAKIILATIEVRSASQSVAKRAANPGGRRSMPTALPGGALR